MKEYKITYREIIKPTYVLSDPYDIYAFPMPEFKGFETVDRLSEETVKAPNKRIAESMLAINIAFKHAGNGYDYTPLIHHALRNIVSYAEVSQK